MREMAVSNGFDPVVNTFSLVARDAENGDMGVVVASKYLAVGAVVPFARANVGAVATQSSANVSYGPRGLDLMGAGQDPETVIQSLTSGDPGRATRQVGMVDARGRSFGYTGESAHDWKGHLFGPDYACQGNLLTGPEVLQAMVSAYHSTTGELAVRLMAALIAGDKAGGDRRGRQAAAILVVRQDSGPLHIGDRYLDLRVDDHPEASEELKRVFDLWHARSRRS
ncbi:MAG: DUF1028 domain-containing protein [Planctomycetes bacterium]|nr:DUF1028 domain-containing protein [Planctomycetota bacterium]